MPKHSSLFKGIHTRMENPFLRYKMFFTIKLAFVIFILCILVYVSLSTFFLPFFSNPVQKNDLFLINNTGNQNVGRNPAELAGLPDSQNGGRYFWHLADGQIVSIYPPMGNCHNMSIVQVYNIENYVMIFEKDGLGKQCAFQLVIDTDKKIEGMVRQPGSTSMKKNKKYTTINNITFSDDFVNKIVNTVLVDNGFTAPEYCDTQYKFLHTVKCPSQWIGSD